MILQIIADICWLPIAAWVWTSQKKQAKMLKEMQDLSERSFAFTSSLPTVKIAAAKPPIVPPVTFSEIPKAPIEFEPLAFVRVDNKMETIGGCSSTVYLWKAVQKGVNFWIKGMPGWNGGGNYNYQGYIEDQNIAYSWCTKEECEDMMMAKIVEDMNFWVNLANKVSSYKEENAE